MKPELLVEPARRQVGEPDLQGRLAGAGVLGKVEQCEQQPFTDSLAALYEFRVDMSRDLRVGDSFTIMAERQHGPQDAVRIGKIVTATLLTGNTPKSTRSSATNSMNSRPTTAAAMLRPTLMTGPP